MHQPFELSSIPSAFRRRLLWQMIGVSFLLIVLFGIFNAVFDDPGTPDLLVTFLTVGICFTRFKLKGWEMYQQQCNSNEPRKFVNNGQRAIGGVLRASGAGVLGFLTLRFVADIASGSDIGMLVGLLIALPLVLTTSASFGLRYGWNVANNDAPRVTQATQRVGE